MFLPTLAHFARLAKCLGAHRILQVTATVPGTFGTEAIGLWGCCGTWTCGGLETTAEVASGYMRPLHLSFAAILEEDGF